MEFAFDKFFWRSEVHLPAWADFTAGRPTVLTFAPEGRNEAPLSLNEIDLATWVQDNYEMQKPLLLNAVVVVYPEFRRQFFEDFSIKENEVDLPTVTSADCLAKVIALENIYVHQILKGGLPYVGYQFSCSWDEEHGLGVLMHGQRVIEIGGADTAFLLWLAERDRDS